MVSWGETGATPVWKNLMISAVQRLGPPDPAARSRLRARALRRSVAARPGGLRAARRNLRGVAGLAPAGHADGKRKRYFIYNVCDHAETYREVRAQAVSYTTGVPAVTGAAMMVTGAWRGAGVFNMEQLDPDPFLEDVAKRGLPWHVEER